MALVPIYQLHRTQGSKTYYYYTPYPPAENWTLDGIAFYGCESDDPGAIPVYMYFYGDESSTQLWYSTESDQSVDGWHVNVTGPAFWTFQPTDPRAQAVLVWTNESPHTHYYGGSGSQWLPAPASSDFTAETTPFFYAVPGNVNLQYALTSLTYGNSSSTLKPAPTFATSENIDNDSSTLTQTVDVALNTIVTNSYTLTLTDTLTVGMSLEFSAGVPDVDSVKGSVSMSVSLSNQQAWTSTTTQEVTVTGSIVAPPNTHAIATMMLTEAQNVSFPCKLTAVASLPGMSSDDLLMVFGNQNPNFNGTVAAKGAHSIAIDLRGTFAGSWNLTASIDLKDKTGGPTNATLSNQAVTSKAA